MRNALFVVLARDAAGLSLRFDPQALAPERLLVFEVGSEVRICPVKLSITNMSVRVQPFGGCTTRIRHDPLRTGRWMPALR